MKKVRLVFAIMVVTMLSTTSAQSQQRNMHGPRWGFAVASTVSKSVPRPRLTTSWNASDNLDSVWIVMGRSRTAPVDSIRISVKSGPPRIPSEKDLIAATYRSDSLGQWVALPKSLLRPGTGERNVPMPMHVLGVFSPTAIASWARLQTPNRPVVTRVAADVWRRNTYERAELYLETEAADAKPPVPTQPKQQRAKPARK